MSLLQYKNVQSLRIQGGKLERNLKIMDLPANKFLLCTIKYLILTYGHVVNSDTEHRQIIYTNIVQICWSPVV
jgi:hypothetical protein